MSRLYKNIIIFILLIAITIPILCSCINKKGSLKKAKIEQQNTTQQANVKGQTIPAKKIRVPNVKGIYITKYMAASSAKLNSIINLSKETELNTVVLDVKDDDGLITYQSSVAVAKNIGASTSNVNIHNIIKTLHDNNIYVIGRVVCFRDPTLAKSRADLSFRAKDGALWKDFSGMPWVNPFNKENWKYIIDVSKEAVDIGFDEIQFDYVRFCNEGNVKNINFGPGFSPDQKPDTIAEFLKTAYKELSGKGIKISADIFGISAITSSDDKILGQNLEKVAKEVEIISPMIYPSHYANIKQNKVGQTINDITFPKPDLDPYNVVFNTLMVCKKRIEANGSKTAIRPYLQAFTAAYLGNGYYQKYGIDQVKEQIKAVYDAGYKEWILWDTSCNYNPNYFERKK